METHVRRSDWQICCGEVENASINGKASFKIDTMRLLARSTLTV
jgi:hypothetical protein